MSSPQNLASHSRAWCPVSTLLALTVTGPLCCGASVRSGSGQSITDLSSEADATACMSGAHTTLPARPCDQVTGHLRSGVLCAYGVSARWSTCGDFWECKVIPFQVLLCSDAHGTTCVWSPHALSSNTGAGRSAAADQKMAGQRRGDTSRSGHPGRLSLPLPRSPALSYPAFHSGPNVSFTSSRSGRWCPAIILVDSVQISEACLPSQVRGLGTKVNTILLWTGAHHLCLQMQRLGV